MPVFRYKLMLLAMLPLFIPAIILIRVLRPLLLIRFGGFNATRIGPQAGKAELYLSQREMGMHAGRILDFFFIDAPACNSTLKEKWKQHLRISWWVRPLEAVNRWFPGHAKHSVLMPSDLDIHGVLERTGPHLSFTKDEEEKGRAALRDLGIQEGAPFVCFFARDQSYLESIAPNPEFFCYTDYRNSSIHHYIPAAEELGRRGYFALRMGAVVKEALDTNDPMIIDYATNGRTDFLDIYLCSKCRFYIGDGGGLNAVPRIFRRPVVYVNIVPLNPDHLFDVLYVPNGLLIPKKHWLIKAERYMTFREILDSPACRFYRAEQYAQLDLEVHENTPEEIAAVAVEMDERLKGTWETTDEDEELQQQFWSMVQPGVVPKANMCRIGAEFLRQNRELLDNGRGNRIGFADCNITSDQPV